MISSARTLGAPVTEPGGNAARIRSTSSGPGERAGHRGDQVPDARVRLEAEQDGDGHRAGDGDPAESLRTRSTIITFSARFFAEASSSARCTAASSSSAARRAVP